MAFAGRYVWLFAALCIACVLIFFWSISGPRLYSAGTSIKDITALLSAIAGVIAGILALLGAIDKMRGSTKSEQNLKPGTRKRMVVPDDRDGRYEWVDTLEFVGRGEDGAELWDRISSKRRPIR
jgi:hypothetical protein